MECGRPCSVSGKQAGRTQGHERGPPSLSFVLATVTPTPAEHVRGTEAEQAQRPGLRQWVDSRTDDDVVHREVVGARRANTLDVEARQRSEDLGTEAERLESLDVVQRQREGAGAGDAESVSSQN